MSSDGNIIAIGAPLNDESGGNSGHVRVFEFNGTNWVQLGQDVDGESTNDQSGRNISLSSNGDRVAIGATTNSGNGFNSGHVRVFEFNGTNWIQLGQDIDGEAAGDQSGFRLNISSDGNIVGVGANVNDGNGTNSGHVRVFEFNGTNWVQIGQDIDGEAAGDQSGSSVSLSSDGSIIAVAAFLNDGNGSNSGHVRVFDISGITLSIDEIGLNNEFIISPNLTTNILNIDLPENTILESINIYNNLGQFIQTTQNKVINTSNIRRGIYFIEIITDRNRITKKIIKK